jgi:hypothetical protein
MTMTLPSLITAPRFTRLRQALQPEAPVLCLLAAYALAASLLLPGLRQGAGPGLAEILINLGVQWLQFLVYFLVFRAFHFAFVARVENPLAQVANECKQLQRYPRFLFMLVLFFGFVFLYGNFKAAIPEFNPFSWDESFMRADRWLHAGRLPHEWLMPLFGGPLSIWFLTQAYNIWFVIMWLMVLGFAWETTKPTLRLQFFVAYFALWALGGSLGGTLFASVGPCFYGPLGLTPDPYAGLMEHLRAINLVLPLETYTTQEALWQRYASGSNFGISAMPSLHNASTFLMMLAAWRIRPIYGWVMLAYTLIIFLSSIMLGWHYALDGYVGWAMAGLLWWGSGHLARWWKPT